MPQGQEPSSKSSSSLIIVLIILIIAAGAYALYRNKASKTDNEATPTESEQPASTLPAPPATPPPPAEGEVKTFTIEAKPFSFTPTEIRVKKGDTVKIVVNNTQGFHDWVLDEFNARTQQTTGPATAEVVFMADKTGTFEFYCSVGEHRKMGMKGNLIVE